MTKRYLCFLLAFVLCVSGFCFPAYAAQANETVVYYADGSYLVTTITEIPTRSTNTKTSSKSGWYYNDNDELQWKITVTGTFSYDGTSAQCTHVSGTTTIENTTLWKLNSESPSRNGATATFSVVLARQFLGISYKKETHSVSITCDKNGNLS